jgi:hypothetical protein
MRQGAKILSEFCPRRPYKAHLSVLTNGRAGNFQVATRLGCSINSGLVDERGLSLKRSSVKKFLFGTQRFRRRYPACPQSGNECCDQR